MRFRVFEGIDGPSIAVLPFVFLNEIEERKALSLGFADALITMLGSLEDFAVKFVAAEKKARLS